MIPKVMHYCWFGGKPLNKLALRCIDSWRKHCPEYEIIEWNESNFDVNMIPYTKQAFQSKKYAFVSDFARFDVVYRMGGIYLDVDVELIKPLDKFLDNSAYMGLERPGLVATGLGFGAEKGHCLIEQIRSLYMTREFITQDGEYDYTTVVQIVSEFLKKAGLNNENHEQTVSFCRIYPTEFFQPLDYLSQTCTITKNTHSIHHYASSWYTPTRRVMKYLSRLAGPKATKFVRKCLTR